PATRTLRNKPYQSREQTTVAANNGRCCAKALHRELQLARRGRGRRAWDETMLLAQIGDSAMHILCVRLRREGAAEVLRIALRQVWVSLAQERHEPLLRARAQVQHIVGDE